MLIRGEGLISMWIPKGAGLIGGRRLFEARRLLGEIRYDYIMLKFTLLQEICHATKCVRT